MQKKNLKVKSKKIVIGWREKINFCGLGLGEISAKVDTGAKTSSLHANDLKTYRRGEKTFVSFKVSPRKNGDICNKVVHSEVIEHRKVKSSNGHVQLRPVILTKVGLLGLKWDIEVTLTDRGEMGFRVLLGREAMRNNFLVDVSKSFMGTRKRKIEI